MTSDYHLIKLGKRPTTALKWDPVLISGWGWCSTVVLCKTSKADKRFSSQPKATPRHGGRESLSGRIFAGTRGHSRERPPCCFTVLRSSRAILNLRYDTTMVSQAKLSYAATPKTSLKYFVSVTYRVTRASGENPAAKKRAPPLPWPLWEEDGRDKRLSPHYTGAPHKRACTNAVYITTIPE